jgi:hypothetical protein
MRCADLAGTWAELCTWFDEQGILVLPQLCTDGPLVRLDAGRVGGGDTADAEQARALERLRAVVSQFDVKAVYVHQWGDGIFEGGPPGGQPEPGAVTVRVMAGGVVHELKLLAPWYAEFLDGTVGIEFAHAP